MVVGVLQSCSTDVMYRHKRYATSTWITLCGHGSSSVAVSATALVRPKDMVDVEALVVVCQVAVELLMASRLSRCMSEDMRM